MPSGDRVEKLDPGRRLINDIFSCVEPSYGFGVFIIDMENAHDLIQRLRQQKNKNITYLHLFIKACSMALERYPQVNAMLDGNRRILHPSSVDIGVSVAGRTNYAPVVVLKDANKKDLFKLAEELNEGAEKARAEEEEFLRRLKWLGRFLPFSWLRKCVIRLVWRIAKVRRAAVGTFQITSLPEEIIVPFRLNTTSLMGIGEVRQRPMVIDGNVLARRSVYIAVPIDHRVVDGRVPMLFVKEVISLMENPEMLVGQ